jgi:hypothetical protein
MVSGIGVFYPDRRPTQRVGIVPDVEVRPTLAGIRAGRDEVLEAALRQILGPAASDAEIRALVPGPRLARAKRGFTGAAASGRSPAPGPCARAAAGRRGSRSRGHEWPVAGGA